MCVRSPPPPMLRHLTPPPLVSSARPTRPAQSVSTLGPAERPASLPEPSQLPSSSTQPGPRAVSWLAPRRLPALVGGWPVSTAGDRGPSFVGSRPAAAATAPPPPPPPRRYTKAHPGRGGPGQGPLPSRSDINDSAQCTPALPCVLLASLVPHPPVQPACRRLNGPRQQLALPSC